MTLHMYEAAHLDNMKLSELPGITVGRRVNSLNRDISGLTGFTLNHRTAPEHEAIDWASRDLYGTPAITLEHHGTFWTTIDRSGPHGPFLNTRDYNGPPKTSVDYQ